MKKSETNRFIKRLRLKPHPEGGFYRETYRSKKIFRSKNFSGPRAASTAIYYLLQANDFSAFHRIRSDEILHFYMGTTAKVYSINLRGKRSIIRLGANWKKGEVFQTVIPAGDWFALEVANKRSFALIGCTVAPGFDFSDFELASCDKLIKQFPRHRQLICRLTRKNKSNVKGRHS